MYFSRCIPGAVENADDLERPGFLQIDDEVLASNGPEEDRFSGELATAVAESRVLSEKLAGVKNVGFELIGGDRVIRRDVGPDFLEVGESLKRKLKSLHS